MRKTYWILALTGATLFWSALLHIAFTMGWMKAVVFFTLLTGMQISNRAQALQEKYDIN